MLKTVIAALLSAALIWLVPHNAQAKQLNNSEAKVAVTKPAGQVHQKVTAPAQEVKQETAPAPQTPAPQPATAPAPVGPDLSTHEGLMTAAGISQSDWPAVDYIVSRESSWNQDATEPNTLAHGLVQALPFSKTGCGWEDAVCTLAWGQTYATSRYGGWWAAMSYWEAHHNW